MGTGVCVALRKWRAAGSAGRPFWDGECCQLESSGPPHVCFCVRRQVHPHLGIRSQLHAASGQPSHCACQQQSWPELAQAVPAMGLCRHLLWFLSGIQSLANHLGSPFERIDRAVLGHARSGQGLSRVRIHCANALERSPGRHRQLLGLCPRPLLLESVRLSLEPKLRCTRSGNDFVLHCRSLCMHYLDQ